MKKLVIAISLLLLIAGCTQTGSNTTHCNEMNISEAIMIAENSECSNKGVIITDDYFCNEITGTWWIGFNASEPVEGCNPACVVNIKDKTASVNWRCTGLTTN
ncbi:hypothetical protein GF352_04060 [archaeon]|nr:hypothetical protein [archaeon]